MAGIVRVKVTVNTELHSNQLGGFSTSTITGILFKLSTMTNSLVETLVVRGLKYLTLSQNSMFGIALLQAVRLAIFTVQHDLASCFKYTSIT